MKPPARLFSKYVGKREGRFSLERFVNVLALVAIYAFLVYYFKPNLIFSLTTTTGGDTGAHISWGWYLKNYLLPKGQVAGWTPDWYAGFPLFQFYPPLHYLVIAFLSYLIPYQVAFKLVTILGIFLLPLTTFLCFKMMRFQFPMPILASAFALPFLFLESYSIYGGNILSTLAGEFGYSISFSLTILFLGLVSRGISEKRYLLLNAILLALIALTHLITVIAIILATAFFLFRRRLLDNLKYLVYMFALAFGLTAFWTVPFLAKLPYATRMKWGQLHGLEILFPREMMVFFVLAAVGVVYALTKRDRRMFFFLWALTPPVLLFFLLPDGRLWNGRFLPFFYFFTFVWAAYGVFQSRQYLSFAAYRVFRLPQRLSDYILPPLALFLVAISILAAAIKVPAWIEWNYSGYEGKLNWTTFRLITQYMKNLPQGRIMWEHSPNLNQFGTQLAFMTFPYFSHQPTMESILLESAFTAAFHFVNQAELSDRPSYAVQGVNYPGFNLANGAAHMQTFNIRYYIGMSPRAVTAADASPMLRLRKRIREFSIYELKTEGYVVVPKYEPLLVKTNDWRGTALKWYSNPAMLDTPLVLSNAKLEKLPNFARVSSTLRDFRKIPLELDDMASVQEAVGKDEIVFRTTAIGKPHWIKMSYFPNWRVEGADGPYLASPSFMVVIPRKNHVRLYYSRTWVDWLGIVISLATLLGMILSRGMAGYRSTL